MERETEREVATENEVETQEAPGKAGWEAALSDAFDQTESGDVDQAANDEFSEIYKPYAEALEREGLTPAEYTRRLIAFGQAVDRAPDEVLWELSSWREGDRTEPHPAIKIHHAFEWQNFVLANPGAEQLRHKMAEHLTSHPEKKGESVRSALTRAYRAVQPKTAPKAQSKAKKQAPRHIRDDVEAAYEEVASKGQR